MHAAALMIGAAGFFSRIIGLFRDRLLASRFGAGRDLDIYYASFQIPDFLAVLFLLGAGSAAILPIFQEYLSRDREKAHRLISDLFTLFLLGASALGFVAFLFAPALARIIAPGFSAEDFARMAALTRIMIIAPVLFGISGIFTSVIESFQRFFAYALAPVLYNLGIIAGIVFLVPVFGVQGLAFGVVFGACLHFFVLLMTVKKLGFSPRLFRPALGAGVRSVIGLSFPRVLSVSISHFTFLALVAVGSMLAAGSIAVFQLAQNLYFVPIGIFGTSYAVVIFPRLSRAYIGRDQETFFRELFIGIHSILFWILPSIALFIVLRAHIVRVALGSGAFSWEDTRLTAATLLLFSFSMFASALIPLFIKGFYALENTWRPLVINVLASGLSVLFALLSLHWLQEGSGFYRFAVIFLRLSGLEDIRVLGLSFGFSAGLFVNVFLLYGALIRLAGEKFNCSRVMPFSGVAKITFAASLAGIAAYAVRVNFSEALPLVTFLRVLSQGIVAGSAGAGAYFGTLLLLKEPSAWSLWHTVRQRVFRIGILPPNWNGETHVHEQRM